VVAGVGVFVTVGAAYVLGRLIAWDALGLHAVTRDVAGVDGALGSSVFVVVIDGHSAAPSTYAAWAYSHLGLAVLAVVALVMVWLRARAAERDRAELSRPRRPGPRAAAQ
jgi:hypothetical protein